MHAATRVISLPNYTRDYCARILGREHVDGIPDWTPVDLQFAAPADKYHSRRFVCLNTFDPHKGHEVLLEAAAILKSRNLRFEIHCYGEGPLLNGTQDRAAALGLREYVNFHARTNNVREVYDRALAVVNPAHAEPFGMTLIEAMARKTPVVATRSGGPEDIVVDGQTGFLVDCGDAAAMADRIEALLDSADLRAPPGRGWI